MYIPKEFKKIAPPGCLSFMQRYPFGTLVSATSGRPTATHIPFHAEIKDDKIVLSSHLALANAQSAQLHGREVLCIFAEPHAYISPQHYDHQQNVPTWNYVAVHAYGRVKLLPDPADAVAVLEKMIAQFEPAYRQQWLGLSAKYKTQLISEIATFEIVIDEVLGVEKLSQNKSRGEQDRIATALGSSAETHERAVAETMRRNHPKKD